MLQQVAPDLFTEEQLLRLPLGVRLPLRMTVVRLPRGGLWVHSPLPLTSDRLKQVVRLDAVEYLVAPSLLHHRFAGPWLARCAGARLYGAPGLDRKRKDLQLSGVLGGKEPAPWTAVLDEALIEGAPRIGETVFFHRPTETLIVSDLLFNVLRPANVPTKLLLTMTGTRGQLAMSRVWRRRTGDLPALRASIERVLRWPFRRILPGHGDIVDGPDAHARARAVLESALA